jgi:ribonuclease P protein component
MIGRSNRFHGHGSIKRLHTTGKTVRTGMMALRFAPNQRRDSYRLAVVVSRKVSKSAVVRNRIRRRLYERVRILSSDFTEPTDLVLYVYDEALAALPADKLARDVDQLFEKAKLTSANPGRHAIVEPKEN